MATREEIIAHWRDGLADAESSEADASLHARWVRRIYSRIYRFLIACYSDATWNTSPDERRSDADESITVMNEIVATDGKPAKTTGEIGEVLNSVHAANEPAAAGDMTAAATQVTWLRAAEFQYRALAVRYVRLLKQVGIDARIVRRTFRYFVDVKRRDIDAAFDVFREHRRSLSNTSHRSRPRRFVRVVYTLLYMLVLLPALVGIIVGTLFGTPSAILWGIAAMLYITGLVVWIAACQHFKLRQPR